MSDSFRESAIMELESVGFTRYEASLYATLVSIGPSTYDELIDESDVPYGRFYVVMDKLVRRGLVEMIPGRPNMFQCISPNIAIGNYLESAKERILQALRKQEVLDAE